MKINRTWSGAGCLACFIALGCFCWVTGFAGIFGTGDRPGQPPLRIELLGSAAIAGEVSRELTPLQRGRGKAQLCTRCHGRLGMARAAQARKWPGTVAEFVEFNLLQFRSGKRIQAVMNAVAGPLSDIDIQDVAIWYQSMSGESDKKPLSE